MGSFKGKNHFREMIRVEIVEGKQKRKSLFPTPQKKGKEKGYLGVGCVTNCT
jgi:hypothetical protein